jgi:hypothetical protein
MRKLLIAATAMAALVAAAPAYAGLDFYFSFINGNGNVSGTVTGEIFGLTDDTTSGATDVVIDSYPAGLSLPAVPWDIFNDSNYTNVGNGFTVSGGVITAAFFAELDFADSSSFSLNDEGFNNVIDLNGNAVENEGGFKGATYTAVPTPEPASIVLLLSGMFGLRLIRRRKGQDFSYL